MKKFFVCILQNSFGWYFSLALLLTAFLFVTHFNGLYGQDAHEYYRYSKALHDFLKSGTNPGDYFWPIIYPLAGALLSFLLPNLVVLQIISVASLIVSICILEKIIALLYQNEKADVRIYLLLFFFLSPYILRASVVVMSDMLAVTFTLAAVYFFYKYWYFRKPKYFTALIFFASLAIATRYSAFAILVIPLMVGFAKFLQKFKLSFFLLGIALAILAFIPHLLIRHSNPIDFIHHAWISNWSMNNFLKSSFSTSDGNAQYTFPNIIYSFFNWIHPAFIFIGVLTLFWSKKFFFKRLTIKILLAMVVLYAFFLAGIPYQNLRFLILSFPLILILFFPAAIQLLERIPIKSRPWLLVCITIVQLVLFTRAFIPFYKYNRLEKEIAAEVRKYPAAPAIYTFEMDGALNSYNVKNKIVGLWNEHIDSIPPHSLLLFNVRKFITQWSGMQVMNNYTRIKHDKRTNSLKAFEDGWQLSEIE